MMTKTKLIALRDLIYSKTKDKVMTENLLSLFETDSELDEMIDYIKNSNPSIEDLNFEAHKIYLRKRGISL